MSFEAKEYSDCPRCWFENSDCRWNTNSKAKEECRDTRQEVCKQEITITCPNGSKISILKGYANDKNFLKEQCSKFWLDDDCECATPKYPTAMKLFARFIGSCCVHDNCYMACGKSKEQCDKEFYDNLEAQCLTELCKRTIRWGAEKIMAMEAAKESYDNAQKKCTKLEDNSA